MRLEIIGTNLPVSPALESHIHDRLESALGRLSRRVKSLTVRLCDDNGHKGGVDKRCRIEVRMSVGQPWIVEAIDTDPYVAVDLAVNNTKRTLVRRLDRAEPRRGRGTDLLRLFTRGPGLTSF